MKLDPKFAVLFVLFSKGRKDKRWMCCGGFVNRQDAVRDAANEHAMRRKIVILRVHVRRPPVKP